MIIQRITIGGATMLVAAAVFYASWLVSHPAATATATYVAPPLIEAPLVRGKPVAVENAPVFTVAKAKKPLVKTNTPDARQAPVDTTSTATGTTTGLTGTGTGTPTTTKTPKKTSSGPLFAKKETEPQR